ncbi:hypothetical protein RBH20_18070 [Haloarcula sp. H-GB4]|uniref:hypothetical protein n=1 Tax=Haloarcula sp. H-GB4 TaxID=3069755 RepID=UPI0027B024E0|nr:hypothetical protein [Haloarcula sp. H-GB4]MDQ2074447.1 hypothetical protein [Haloarcula sp. H-GB4]
MPSLNRRAFLATLGASTVGKLAGCSTIGTDDPPAGSLQFINQDSLPHAMQLAVTDVGSELNNETGTVAGDVPVPAPQRNLTATEQLSSEESTTYTDVFTEPVWYAVECTVDGQQTTQEEFQTEAMFHPAPPGREYVNYLQAVLRDSGQIELAVVTTDNSGRYTPSISK